jgi:hypothetical protein
VFGGIAGALKHVPETTTVDLALDIQPSGGPKRTDAARLTVELRPYPQWSLWAGAALLFGTPIVLTIALIVGPRFPRAFLTPCDLSGRATKDGVLIELQRYRRRLPLDRWGLLDATLRVTFRKQILVALGPGPRLLKASDGYRRTAAVSMQTCILEPGDIVSAEDGGKTTAYKFG